MTSLARSNKHLSTPAKRKKAVFVTVSTSSAIEGIRTPFKVMKTPGKTQTGAFKPVKRPRPSKSA